MTETPSPTSRTPRRGRRRAAIVGVVLATLSATLFSAFWYYGDHLWARWIVDEVRAELADPDFVPTNPGPECTALFDTFHRSQLVWEMLLEDNDYRVWTNLVALLDSRLDEGTRHDFIAHLRHSSSLGCVRYLFLPQYSTESEWRSAAGSTGLIRGSTFPNVEDEGTYWTGSEHGVAEYSTHAIDFLTDALRDRIGFDGPKEYAGVFQRRAVFALVHALPGSVDGTPLPERTPRNRTQRRVLSVLHDYVQTTPILSHRIFAASRLRLRAGHLAATSVLDDIAIEQSVKDRLVFRNRRRLLGPRPGAIADLVPVPSDPHLPLLLEVDHPRSLALALDLLLANARTQPLETVLATRPPCPYSPPRRPETPLEQARSRLADEGPTSLYAAVLLAKLNDRESLPRLLELAREEPNADRQAIFESACLALGHSAPPTRILTKLSELTLKTDGQFPTQSFLPASDMPKPMTPFLFPASAVRGEDGFSSLAGASWIGADRWDVWKFFATGDLSGDGDTVEILFRNLMRSGNRDALGKLLPLGSAADLDPSEFFELPKESQTDGLKNAREAFSLGDDQGWTVLAELFATDLARFAWNAKTRRWSIHR